MATEKIAFLFLTYIQPHKADFWERYLRPFPTRHSVYMHPKFPNKTSNPFFKQAIIAKHSQTNWGGLGLVRATLYLLEAALKDRNNKYFVVLSDSCIPLYGFNDLYQRVTSQKLSMMSCITCKGKERVKPSAKIKPEHLRKQSQWMMLTREDAEFFLDIKHQHLDELGRVFIPDEKYFVTVLTAYNRPFRPQMPTFVLWKKNILDPKLEGQLKKHINVKTPRIKRNSIAERQLQQKSKRFYGHRNLNTDGHPITFNQVNANLVKVARARGCFFFRKVGPKTTMHLPFRVGAAPPCKNDGKKET